MFKQIGMIIARLQRLLNGGFKLAHRKVQETF